MSSSELERAYVGTEYRVSSVDPPIILKIGKRSEQVDQLLLEHGCGSWAFITPCNPRSVELTDEQNKRRLEAFAATISSQFELLLGEGVGENPEWSPEPSYLILGIHKENALSLATHWEQNAFVFGELGSAAELVWCPTIHSPQSSERE